MSILRSSPEHDRSTLALCAFVFVAASGCGGAEVARPPPVGAETTSARLEPPANTGTQQTVPEASPLRPVIPSRVGAEAAAGEPQSTTTTGGSETKTDTSATLTDGQIAELANQVSTKIINDGHFAAEHATNPRVKRFAQHMVDMHADISQRNMMLLQQHGIVPAPSPRSVQRSVDLHAESESLQTKTGADFDRAYAETQVKNLKEAINLWDGLIGDARDSDLRAALRDERGKLAQQLEEAQAVRRAAAP